MNSQLTSDEFRALLDWFMCSDPWPAGDTTHATVEALLDRVSREYGYDGWVVAFHEHQKLERYKTTGLTDG
jgi:hypothetical protein